MSFLGRNNFYYDVALGNVSDQSITHKFGRNPDIATASGFEAVWNGGGSYTGHDPSAAETVEVFSSDANDAAAGTGARTVQVYGLDSDWAEQNETVTLNGATAVDTANTYIRLNRMIVRTVGSTGSNEGTITARQNVTTANVFAVMPIGYNQTMIAAWTVPSATDRNAFIQAWYASLAGKTSANCNVRLLARPFGECFQVKEEIALMGAGSSYIYRRYDSPKGPFAAKTDIVVEADTDTNNTGLAAGFDLIF
jgi:hypothetical protein